MKKSFFWSLLAATAMMTACSEDSLVDSSQPLVTGVETPIDFKIKMGNEISTYAGTDDAVGGWTNWKNKDTEMFGQVNARATLQVFANGQTSPYAQVRTVLTETPEGNEIGLPQFRLPAGNSYTAVVWVDFVPEKTSTTEERNDYFWNTENLSKVSELNFTDGLMPIDKTPEARDAYTGLIKFTVNADGTYNLVDGENTESNSVAIPITATRKFAKISLVLTDYDNKTEWIDALNNLGTDNILEYLGMQVTNLSTGYNALEQSPISAEGTTESYFHRQFDVTSANSESDNVNGVKWFNDNGKIYPIFDFNYVIPEKAGKDATYSLSFKGYNMEGTPAFTADAAKLTTINDSVAGFKLVAIRNASNVPVRTNAHTIIKMNLYKAYSCNVTIIDQFTGGTENVVITDDDKKTSVDEHEIDGAKVEVVRGDDGKATSIKITGVTAENFDAVIDDIVAMKNLASADFAKLPPIFMNAISLPVPANFSDLKGGEVTNNINLTLNEIDLTLPDDEKIYPNVELEGLSNEISLQMPMINTLKVTSTRRVLINSVHAKDSTIITARYMDFKGGIYDGSVNVKGTNDADSRAVIYSGTFNNNFNSSVNTFINGGTLPKVTENGNDMPVYKLTMDKGKRLTLYTNAFGPLNAKEDAGCDLYYTGFTLSDYQFTLGGNWAHSVYFE